MWASLQSHMGSCMSTEATASGKSSKQSKDGGMGRLSTQYASMYRCELSLDVGSPSPGKADRLLGELQRCFTLAIPSRFYPPI